MQQRQYVWVFGAVFAAVVMFGAVTTSFYDQKSGKTVKKDPQLRTKILEAFKTTNESTHQVEENELITACCNENCSVSVEVHKILNSNGSSYFQVEQKDANSTSQLTFFQWFANYMNLGQNSESNKPLDIQCSEMVKQLELAEELKELNLNVPETEILQGLSGNKSLLLNDTPIQIHEILQKLTGNSVEYHPDHRNVPVWMVFLCTTVMAAAAGLGAVPFFFIKHMSPFWSGICHAIACGVMLAAGFDLIKEGQPYGRAHVIIGILVGVFFVHWLHKFLHRYEEVKFENIKGVNAKKLLVFISIMAAHAIGEGAGVGVSFSGRRGWTQGLLVTLAIGIHNIPEGLATSTILIGRGCNAKQALLWTLFTALPQPLVAVPAFVFVESFKACLPVAMGFAGGCMLWIVFAELLPEALEQCEHSVVASVTCLSAAWLEGLGMFLFAVENPNNTLATPTW
eukprot:TRINITY_DN538_c0_g3_i1.p1 TRINITY_DN538_c0_g3~~TRINITY_DN538_c0_g3_i1.p1  ORF type:complete len:455 (-),score=81.66 TRINITY_DN538_c0_g3_i1:253-1617(-)